MLRGTQALRRCAWQLPVRTSQRCLSSASPEAQLEDKLRGSLRGVQHVKVSRRQHAGSARLGVHLSGVEGCGTGAGERHERRVWDYVRRGCHG